MQTSTSIGIGHGGQSSPAQPGRAFASTSVAVFCCDLGADGLPVSSMRLTTNPEIRLCMSSVPSQSIIAAFLTPTAHRAFLLVNVRFRGGLSGHFRGSRCLYHPPVEAHSTTSTVFGARTKTPSSLQCLTDRRFATAHPECDFPTE